MRTEDANAARYAIAKKPQTTMALAFAAAENRKRQVFCATTFGKSSWVQPEIFPKLTTPTPGNSEPVTENLLTEEEVTFLTYMRSHPTIWRQYTAEVAAYQVLEEEEADRAEESDEPEHSSVHYHLVVELEQKTKSYGLTLCPSEVRKLTTTLAGIKGLEWELSRVKQEESDMKKITLENILKIL
jgi:hypothetical protein